MHFRFEFARPSRVGVWFGDGCTLSAASGKTGGPVCKAERCKGEVDTGEQEMAIQFSVQEAILRAASSYQVMILAHAGLQAADHRLKATSAWYATDRVPLYQMREAQEAWQQAFDAHEDSKIEYAGRFDRYRSRAVDTCKKCKSRLLTRSYRPSKVHGTNRRHPIV